MVNCVWGTADGGVMRCGLVLYVLSGECVLVVVVVLVCVGILQMVE